MITDATTTLARAWSIQRRDGFTLGFTDHDTLLRFDGLEYRPRTGMEARSITQGIGLSVDNSEAVGLLSDDAITETDLRAGRWDGAAIRLWEVDWSATDRRNLLFCGSLGEVVSGAGTYRAELRGLTEVLNQPQGRVYHPGCSAVLGDRSCRVDLDAAGPGGVALVTKAVVTARDAGGSWTVLAEGNHEAGWFDHGQVVLLDGAGKGLEGMIRKDVPLGHGARRLDFWQEPAIPPVIGASVRMIAGCNKAADTCRSKFANFMNYRGFPHLPSEDWLLAPHLQGASDG